MNSVTVKDSSTEQNKEADRRSKSVTDLVDISKEKSLCVPGSRPPPTVAPITFNKHRAAYIDQVAVQCERKQNHRHRGVSHCCATFNCTFTIRDDRQHNYC